MSKAAVVTGASRGIGKAIAEKLAKEGYELCISCRNHGEKLEEWIRQLSEKTGVRVRLFLGDMGDPDAVREMFSIVQKEFGGLDILVNNAGISKIGLFTEMSDEEWQEILNSNLSSVFYCSREAAKLMLHKKQGKIINISSVWGNVGASCEAAYSATKSGINGLTKAVAKELAPSNIQVNAVACGAIDTQMNQFLDEEERRMLLDEIPSGRMGRTEEVAEFVWDLCNGNEYLTGQIVSLDGGWI
ncbi:MAG: elongation factor P 5-aminopentanone reductase [Lachnospiraceae bacterium]